MGAPISTRTRRNSRSCTTSRSKVDAPVDTLWMLPSSEHHREIPIVPLVYVGLADARGFATCAARRARCSRRRKHRDFHLPVFASCSPFALRFVDEHSLTEVEIEAVKKAR